jgi:hypothetical protein
MKGSILAVAAAFLVAGAPAWGATDPLASATKGNVAIGGDHAPAPKLVVRKAHPRLSHHRGTEMGAQTVPAIGRPALTGVTVLAPAVLDYPPLAPEPRDDAAALTPAFYLGGLARVLTQPPPPPECRPQRRGDAALPGYVRGAPLDCASFDP